jgi:hypothetical protein
MNKNLLIVGSAWLSCCSTALAFQCDLGENDTNANFSEAKFYLYIPSDATITSCWTGAYVSIGAFWTYPDCEEPDLSGSFHSVDFATSTSCTSASAIGPFRGGTAGIGHCGSAAACCPDYDPNTPELIVKDKSWPIPGLCAEPWGYQWPVGVPYGIEAAWASFLYTAGPSQQLWSYGVGTTMYTQWINGEIFLPDLPRPTRLFREVQAVYSGGELLHFPTVTYAGDNWSLGEWVDDGEGEASFSDSGTGASGAQEMATLRLYFDDARMDVDPDGRFNQVDVDALSTIASGDPTNENALSLWNFYPRPNGSNAQVIDSEDVAVMQSIVDAGLSSGFLGDRDGDGTVDCDDLSSVNSHFGHHLGESQY